MIKVGRTNKHPEIRANELSRQTGTIGKFIVEWHLEVPDSELAEKVAHFKLREFHHLKEYYSISAYDAHLILEKFIISLFEIEKPVIFYSETIEVKVKKIEYLKARYKNLLALQKEALNNISESEEEVAQKNRNERIRNASNSLRRYNENNN